MNEQESEKNTPKVTSPKPSSATGLSKPSNLSARFAPLAYRRPALFALVAICSGIVLGQYNLLTYWAWLATALLALTGAGVALSGAQPSRVRFKSGIALTLLGLLALLSFRVVYSRSGSPPDHILHSVDDGSQYRIYGSISDWPDVREHSTRLTVRIDSTARVVAEGRYGKTAPRSGSVMVYVNTQTTDFQYADRIVFSGKFVSVPEKKNPGGFDYARYLRWNDVFAMVYLPHHFGVVRNPETSLSVGGLTRFVREYILSVFRQVLQEQPAALASGFLIGETTGIDDDVYRQFRRSGTLHLLAVSGSNVAVALLVLRMFLWPFPIGRRKRYFVLILGAIFFSFISHNDPSVVRASVMVTLFLLGRTFERKIDYHNIIAASGAIILLWNPNQLFDVGFQLSFVVTWALILFLPPIHHYCERWRRALWYKFLALPLTFAFVAQLSSIPIVLYYFGVAPLNATISNLIIGPAVGGAVALSLITLVGASVLPLLGAFFGAALNLWLTGILSALNYLGGQGVWQLRTDDFSALYAFVGLAIVFLLGASLTSRVARRLGVFVLVIAPIVLFVSHTSQSIRRDVATTTILASRGGICAVVSGSPPTVILSDIADKPESQFQYVVEPALRLANVSDEVHLAQLSADYQTLVTALTICDSFPQSELSLTANAERLWQDYRTQYKIESQTYQLRFSSEIDSSVLSQALQRISAQTPVDMPSQGKGYSLFLGSTLALQVSGSLRALYLSSAPSAVEMRIIKGVFRSLLINNNLSHAESKLIVVVDKLDSPISLMLNDFSHVLELRIIAGRRNHSLQLTADFAQLITYIEDVGAVTISSH